MKVPSATLPKDLDDKVVLVARRLRKPRRTVLDDVNAVWELVRSAKAARVRVLTVGAAYASRRS